MNGCCTTDFQKKVSEFISSATCMVAKDNNNKRAIIVIAVEENEKGDNANTQVLAAGTEEKLVVIGLTVFEPRTAIHRSRKGVEDFDTRILYVGDG